MKLQSVETDEVFIASVDLIQPSREEMLEKYEEAYRNRNENLIPVDSLLQTVNFLEEKINPLVLFLGRQPPTSYIFRR